MQTPEDVLAQKLAQAKQIDPNVGEADVLCCNCSSVCSHVSQNPDNGIGAAIKFRCSSVCKGIWYFCIPCQQKYRNIKKHQGAQRHKEKYHSMTASIAILLPVVPTPTIPPMPLMIPFSSKELKPEDIAKHFHEYLKCEDMMRYHSAESRKEYGGIQYLV